MIFAFVYKLLGLQIGVAYADKERMELFLTCLLRSNIRAQTLRHRYKLVWHFHKNSNLHRHNHEIY